MLQSAPYKLLLVSTGNIDNNALLDLFTANMAEIANLFESYAFVELDRDQMIAHQ